MPDGLGHIVQSCPRLPGASRPADARALASGRMPPDPVRQERHQHRHQQEARQLQRADEHRIEVQRQRQHHHGVLRAGREGQHRIGGPHRHQHGQRQHRQRRDRHRHRERSQRRAEEAQQCVRIGVGEPRAGDRADADHRRVGHPPGQDRVNEAAAVQDGGRQHGAEHQPARQPQLEKHQRRDGGRGDQDGKLRNRRRAGRDEARHQAAALDRQPEAATARPECPGSAPPPAWSARWRWRGGRPCTRTPASSPGRARRGLRRTAPIARPSRARSADRSSSR